MQVEHSLKPRMQNTGFGKGVSKTMIKGPRIRDNKSITEAEEMITEVIEKYAVYNSDALISDHKEDLVCFCDPQTKSINEIFTSNDDLKNSFEREIKEGKSCYEMLKGRSTPCPFCSDELLIKDRYYVWPYHDLATDNTYIHKSRTILRGGRSVRMEVLQDVTDPDRKDAMLTQALKSMRLWAECARLMSHDYPFREALQFLLEEMVVYLNAQSGYLVFFNNDELRLSWPLENTEIIPDYFEDPSQAAIDRWTHAFSDRAHVYVEDIKTADVPQKMKEYWLAQGRESLLSFPLFIGDDLCGQLCLNNISMNTLQAGMVDLIAESIVETYQRYEKFEYEEMMKYHDGVSGALNLEGFKHIAHHVLDENPNSTYAFWYCDIRNFRYINDLFGYETGHKFMQYWIDTLTDTLRESDVFGRNSIDGIIALQKYSSINGIRERFKKRIENLARFPEFEKRGYRPELVCGVYLVSSEELGNPDLDLMLNRASIAEKVAREKPGSQLEFYNDELREHQLREMSIKQGVESGLKNGEFLIHLQPQYQFDTREIVGAEALVRWQHPQYGFLSPDDFIPILEQTGQITELDLFVCEEVCKVLKKLLDNAENKNPIPISVNLSRIDVQKPDICEKLQNLLRKYDIPFKYLRLEITESAFVDGSDVLIERVKELRSCGFGIEMDDFGRGYSSLTTLKDVVVDVLKLDMGFLKEGYNKGRAGEILKAVIDMANNIGATTLAEGVETLEQAEYLHSLNCKLMQGFFFARPLSIEDFEKLCKESSIKAFKL